MRWVSVLMLVACHATPEDNKADDCDVICRCAFVLPSEQAQCNAECATRITADDACTQCVLENGERCEAVLSTCFDICLQNPMPGEVP